MFQFYTLTIRDSNGNYVGLDQIYLQLKCIMEESRRKERKGQVGIVTSDTRDNWHQAYQTIIGKQDEAFQTMANSLFLLCLDDIVISEEDSLTRTGLNSLHGLGSSNNGINRWYDKALQFIIARSGEVAICNEHRYDHL